VVHIVQLRLTQMNITWSHTVMMPLSDFGLFGIDRYEEMTASCKSKQRARLSSKLHAPAC
jgi:hypothetical protein